MDLKVKSMLQIRLWRHRILFSTNHCTSSFKNTSRNHY